MSHHEGLICNNLLPYTEMMRRAGPTSLTLSDVIRALAPDVTSPRASHPMSPGPELTIGGQELRLPRLEGGVARAASQGVTVS